MGILGYFKSAEGCGGQQRRDTRFLGLLGREGNIYFSGTTGPKVHQLVWNSSLGTGLGSDEFKRSGFWGISSSPTVSVVGSDTRNPFLGLLGKEGNINFSGTTGPKVHRLVWNSSLGTGLGGDEFKRSGFWGISSPPRVSVVGSDAKPDYWDCWGRREIFISRQPWVQKCSNLL